jgi:hypothetical protein
LTAPASAPQTDVFETESNVKRHKHFHRLALALVALATVSNASAFDPHRFQSLRAAASTMKVAAAHNVTYERFGELARQLATELLAVREAARSDEDRALLLLYARAGLAYGDSLTLWREKDEVQHTNSLSKDAPGVKPLIARYDLPVDAEGTIEARAAIRILWKSAAKDLVKAELFYSGRVDEISIAVDAEQRGSASPQKPHPNDFPSAAQDAARRIALIERVAQEFDQAERETERPKPYQAVIGAWTCPRGYVLRKGRCFSDEEIARMPKMEVSP